jgi:predicted branched-subunit amino acid permease
MADEAWAFGLEDAASRDERGLKGQLSLPFYAGLAAALYGTWLVSTTVGALIGSKIGNPQVFGLDMAFPAVFLVILRGLWKGYRAAIPWVVSLVVAVALHLYIPGSWYVAGGTLAGLIVAYLISGRKEC